MLRGRIIGVSSPAGRRFGWRCQPNRQERDRCRPPRPSSPVSPRPQKQLLEELPSADGPAVVEFGRQSNLHRYYAESKTTSLEMDSCLIGGSYTSEEHSICRERMASLRQSRTKGVLEAARINQ